MKITASSGSILDEIQHNRDYYHQELQRIIGKTALLGEMDLLRRDDKAFRLLNGLDFRNVYSMQTALSGAVELQKLAVAFKAHQLTHMASDLFEHEAFTGRPKRMFDVYRTSNQLENEFTRAGLGLNSIYKPNLAALQRFTAAESIFNEALTSSAVLAEFDRLTNVAASMPLISSAVAFTIADHWRAIGLHEDLQAIHNQLARLSRVDYEIVTPEEFEALEVAYAAFAKKKNILDPATLFTLILTILIFLWQEHSSSEMEKRLNLKTESLQIQLDKNYNQVEALTRLVVQAIQVSDIPAKGRISFRVRKRPAGVRKLPKSGATLIGNLVPAQQVILVEEKGEWILVQYFDWHFQDTRTGWVLKKYLLRIAPSSL